jgi:hypothetical protein
VLARADVALARSLITPTLLRGEVSEGLVNAGLLRQLESSGDWRMIRPRLGAQGIDGILVKLDENGKPRKLLVAETKYNSARLGMTADGIQMAGPWRRTRLSALANQYKRVGATLAIENTAIEAPPVGLAPHSQLDVPLSEGRVAKFWRDDSGVWKLDAAGASTQEVRSQANALEALLNGAAEGRISYRARIFSLKPAGDRLAVTVRDARPLDLGARTLNQLPQTGAFEIPLTGLQGAHVGRAVQSELARSIQRKLPQLPDEEALLLSKAVAIDGNRLSGLRGLSGRTPSYHLAGTSAGAGLVGAVLDPLVTVGSDWLVSGQMHIDGRRLAESAATTFVSTAAGVFAGQSTVLVITRNEILNQFAQRAAGGLGIPSTSLLTNAAGGIVGGGVTSIAYALVGYELGWMNAPAARRNATSGIIAGTVGTSALTGALIIVATYGTASTGTAISTLSGAAATSASLAWFGGSSVAAGGGGVAAGSAVLTGGVAVVVIIAAVGVEYAFQYQDEKRESQRIVLTIQELKSHEEFENRNLPSR